MTTESERSEAPLLPDVYAIAPRLAATLERHVQWRIGRWMPAEPRAFLDETRELLAVYDAWARRGEQ